MLKFTGKSNVYVGNTKIIKNIHPLFVVILLGSLCLFPLFSFSQTIKYHSPKIISPNDEFIFTGSGFGAKRCDNCAVYFGKKKIFKYKRWNDNEVVGYAPKYITPGKHELIFAINGKRKKSGRFFTVEGTSSNPKLKYHSPKTLKPGGQFILTGRGFGSKKCSECNISLGNKKIYSFPTWTNTKIVGKAPKYISSGKYELILNFKNKKISTKRFFNVLGKNSRQKIKPTKKQKKPEDRKVSIKYYTPKQIGSDEPFVITGIDFGSERYKGCLVYFGTNKVYTYVTWSDKKIAGKSPKYIKPGTHEIIIVRGKYKYYTKKYIRVLGVASIEQKPDPRSQILFGTANFLHIKGHGFAPVQASGYVLIGKLKITKVVKWNDSSIIIPLSDQIRPGKYNVIIVSPNGSRNKYNRKIKIRGIRSILPVTDTVGGLVTISGNGFGYNSNSILKLENFIVEKYKKWSDDEVIFEIPRNILPGVYKVNMSIMVSPYSSKFVDFTSNDSITILYRVNTIIKRVFGSYYQVSLRPSIFNKDENFIRLIYSIPQDYPISLSIYNTTGTLISNIIKKDIPTKRGRYSVQIEKQDLPAGRYRLFMDINEKVKIIRSFDITKID